MLANHMTIFTLFLAYILSGEIHVEQKGYADLDACMKAGQERVAALESDPRYEGALAGACVKTKGQRS